MKSPNHMIHKEIFPLIKIKAHRALSVLPSFSMTPRPRKAEDGQTLLHAWFMCCPMMGYDVFFLLTALLCCCLCRSVHRLPSWVTRGALPVGKVLEYATA